MLFNNNSRVLPASMLHMANISGPRTLHFSASIKAL